MESTPTLNRMLRGARPDAETFDKAYLIKKVSSLRATYQIRLLAIATAAQGKKLVLKVPRICRFDTSLQGLMQAMPGVIQREDLS